MIERENVQRQSDQPVNQHQDDVGNNPEQKRVQNQIELASLFFRAVFRMNFHPEEAGQKNDREFKEKARNAQIHRRGLKITKKKIGAIAPTVMRNKARPRTKAGDGLDH
ncbi:hypothetical protein GGD83_000697 [Rhodoblastus sphagnicola]|nr:hypothetical protein [Rhodoblastus sphagnicola]